MYSSKQMSDQDGECNYSDSPQAHFMKEMGHLYGFFLLPSVLCSLRITVFSRTSDSVSGRKIAIDASMSIYQFLIAVRSDGSQLTNEAGEITR